MTAYAVYGSFEILEGPVNASGVTLAFSFIDAAREWYDSVDYQTELLHRLRGAYYRVILMDGVDNVQSGEKK